MHLSRIFIERPIATTVIVAAIIIFGLIAFRTLPVNELPNVDFPTIRVDAEMRGANPEVMALVFTLAGGATRAPKEVRRTN